MNGDGVLSKSKGDGEMFGFVLGLGRVNICVGRWVLSIFTVLLFLAGYASLEAADAVADPWASYSQYLHGTWDVLSGHAEEELFDSEKAAAFQWGSVDVPGLWKHAENVEDQAPYVWYRKRFEVPAEARYRLAVLRLAAVRWGSTIWINGKRVGGHLGAFGVNDFSVTKFLKPGATNEIVMRLTGWPSLPRSEKRRQPLVPAGSAPHSWGMKSGGVAEFIALHYFDETYIRSARILADPATGMVNVRVRFRNYGWHYGLITARLDVLRKGVVVASSESELGRRISLRAKRTDQYGNLQVRVKDVDLWNPEDPKLYSMRVTLLHNGKVADVFEERFGFRTFEIKGGHFFLNGVRVLLRGTNLSGEYVNQKHVSTEGIKRYLCDLPRSFNANCIRGHSIPFPVPWLNVADEEGMLLLQEFPLTVNYDRFEFTPKEFATFRTNLESEYLTMIELYWNHPSIIMWVPTNESPRWEEWENGALYRMFKEADPSRPVLRAGRQSPDVYDTHCYDGWWMGAVGDFHQMMAEAAGEARVLGLPYTNTEYVENSNKNRAYRFLGPVVDRMNKPELTTALDRLRAEITSEQSEFLRMTGAQLILHYYGVQVRKWFDVDAAAPTESFHALRNAYAPVGVAIELFDKHFYSDHSLTVPVHVMNDQNRKVSGTLQVALLPSEPGFDWDGADVKDFLWQKTRSVRVRAFDRATVKIELPLPAKEGRWMLAAVWRCDGKEPVHSRRTVFTLAPPSKSPLAGRAIAVFDTDGMLTTWLKKQGASLVDLSKADIALVAPRIHRLAAFADSAGALREFVEKGKDLIVLEQDRWMFDSLAKVTTVPLGLRGGISTVFKKDLPEHRIWRNVPESFMRRWNGLPGAVASHALRTDLEHVVLAIGTEKSKYPKTEVCIEIKAGAGRILFCQFAVQDRLNHDQPDFDPVAERILLNLMSE